MSNYFFRKEDDPSAEPAGALDPIATSDVPEPDTVSQTISQTMRQTTEESVIHAGNEGSAVVLRLAITRTARRMRQEAGSDLSPTALAALASIERHAPLTPTALADIE